jgi:hypothetical protein
MDMIFLQVWFAHFVLQLILQVYSTVELNGRKNKHSLISMHLHGFVFQQHLMFLYLLIILPPSYKERHYRFVAQIKDEAK